MSFARPNIPYFLEQSFKNIYNIICYCLHFANKELNVRDIFNYWNAIEYNLPYSIYYQSSLKVNKFIFKNYFRNTNALSVFPGMIRLRECEFL